MVESELSKYIRPTNDVIIKADANESIGILIHNNDKFAPGSVISRGALKLLRISFFGEQIPTIGEAIQELVQQLGAEEGAIPGIKESVLRFLDSNPAFTITETTPNSGPITSSQVTIPTDLSIPKVTTPLLTKSGIVYRRQIEQNEIQINISGMVLPSKAAPIINEPAILSLPSIEPGAFELTGNEAADREVARTVSNSLGLKRSPFKVMEEVPEMSECGACGACAACLLCAGGTNFSIAGTATGMLLYLFPEVPTPPREA